MVMVNRDEFRELFTGVLPILRAGQQHTTVLLTPLVRYLIQSCCRDPTHITNRCEPRYAAAIAEAMCEIKGWLKGLAFTCRLKNEMLGQEDRHFWDTDPVHMVEAGYKELGKRLLEAMANADVSCKTDVTTYQQSSMPGTDWAEMRTSCVKGHDSQAHRDYGANERRRGRGGQKWRSHSSGKGSRGGNRGREGLYRGAFKKKTSNRISFVLY
jgi:hypothetical protein